MIQSIWRTKWPALVKIPSYESKQSCCVRSFRHLCSVILPSISNPTELFRSVPSEKSKLVLEFLTDCGFSETQIKSIVSGWPRILLCDPKETLKPKVDFFLSKGISRVKFGRILLGEPKALSRSLEKHWIRVFDFLESVVGSEKAARIVRNCPYIFCSSSRGSLELNTMKLQNIGVPKSQIAKMIVNHTRTPSIMV